VHGLPTFGTEGDGDGRSGSNVSRGSEPAVKGRDVTAVEDLVLLRGGHADAAALQNPHDSPGFAFGLAPRFSPGSPIWIGSLAQVAVDRLLQVTRSTTGHWYLSCR
jgi:hypothetical protein